MKTFLTLLFMGMIQLSFGQIAKGTLRLGPEIEYSSTKTEIDGFDVDLVDTDLTLGVGFGYYIIDNLEIGVSLAYISSKSEFDDFEGTSTGVFIGPVIQYKVPLTDKLYLPLGAGFGYNSFSSEDDNSDETKYTGISYSAFTGLEFVVNNQLGAFLHIGPEFGSFKDTDSDDEFDLTVFGAGVGFNFYF